MICGKLNVIRDKKVCFTMEAEVRGEVVSPQVLFVLKTEFTMDHNSCIH